MKKVIAILVAVVFAGSLYAAPAEAVKVDKARILCSTDISAIA